MLFLKQEPVNGDSYWIITVDGERRGSILRLSDSKGTLGYNVCAGESVKESGFVDGGSPESEMSFSVSEFGGWRGALRAAKEWAKEYITLALITKARLCSDISATAYAFAEAVYDNRPSGMVWRDNNDALLAASYARDHAAIASRDYWVTVDTLEHL